MQFFPSFFFCVTSHLCSVSTHTANSCRFLVSKAGNELVKKLNKSTGKFRKFNNNVVKGARASPTSIGSKPVKFVKKATKAKFKKKRRFPKRKRWLFSKLAIRFSPWFAYFSGIICRQGKRFLSETLLSTSLFLFGVRRRGLLTPYNVLSKRYEKLRPLLTYKSVRVAGQTQFIPCSITPDRQKHLAFKWLFEAARSRSERGFSLKLKSELVDLFKGRGERLRRRRDHYNLIRSNRSLLSNRRLLFLICLACPFIFGFGQVAGQVQVLLVFLVAVAGHICAFPYTIFLFFLLRFLFLSGSLSSGIRKKLLIFFFLPVEKPFFAPLLVASFRVLFFLWAPALQSSLVIGFLFFLFLRELVFTIFLLFRAVFVLVTKNVHLFLPRPVPLSFFCVGILPTIL